MATRMAVSKTEYAWPGLSANLMQKIGTEGLTIRQSEVDQNLIPPSPVSRKADQPRSQTAAGVSGELLEKIRIVQSPDIMLASASSISE